MEFAMDDEEHLALDDFDADFFAQITREYDADLDSEGFSNSRSNSHSSPSLSASADAPYAWDTLSQLDDLSEPGFAVPTQSSYQEDAMILSPSRGAPSSSSSSSSSPSLPANSPHHPRRRNGLKRERSLTEVPNSYASSSSSSVAVPLVSESAGASESDEEYARALVMREGSSAYSQLSSFHSVVLLVQPRMNTANLDLALGYTHLFLTDVDPVAASAIPPPWPTQQPQTQPQPMPPSSSSSTSMAPPHSSSHSSSATPTQSFSTPPKPTSAQSNDLSSYTHYTPVAQYEFHDETEEKRQELTADPAQRPKKKFRIISPGTMRRKIEEKKKPKLAAQIATAPPKMPVRLNDFEILDNLKYGGYGVMRLARHVHSKKLYALKSLLRSTLVRHAQVQHVQHEKQLLLSLSQSSSSTSSHSIRLHATFNDRRSLHLLLEFVPGGELLTYIRHHGRFPASVAKFYAAELVLALEYLHERGIVYRDLKPENVLLDLRGYVKLCDFGFARTLAPGERAWTMCGTPDYIAPEVIACSGYALSVDWWSLGVLCFEMQAGYPPFAAPDTLQVFANIQRAHELQYPSTMEPVSVQFMRRLLELDASTRLGSGAASSQQVKSHAWFKTEPAVAWDAFARRAVPAPIVPKFDATAAMNYPPVSDNSDRFVHDPHILVPPDVEHFFNTF